MATHSQGVFSKVLIGTSSFGSDTADGKAPYTWGDAKQIEILGESIAKQARHLGGQGIRGTLSDASERIRQGASFIQGELHFYVSPNLLDLLLDEVLGFTLSNGIHTVSDIIPYFGLLIDRDEGLVEFQDCKVNYWEIRSRAPRFGEQGEPDMVYMTLGIIGTQEVVTGLSWPNPEPALGTAAADAPYLIADLDNVTGVTLNGTKRDVEEFVLRVNYFLKAKYTSSLTPHSLCPTNRRVQASFRLPWNSDNADLYGLAVAGQRAQIKFVNGNMSVLFDMIRFQVPDISPVIPGKDQIPLVIHGIARSSGSTKELIVTNDAVA